ncbi:hypothetical protein AADG42_05595 [Ammonicoccus fulvus]|uniref:RCK C-terminal domain-containing protein n=1 Tax=Ammonicoccus fulvus TaxID=3138240 RepID=A0ABZ3FPV9_9ACTN
MADRLEFGLDEVGDDPDATARAISLHLADLATEAQAIGRPWADHELPGAVRLAILRAMIRWCRRPDAETVSRAGDELLEFGDAGHGGVPTFTPAERQAIARAAVPFTPVGTLATSRYGPMRQPDPWRPWH